MPTNAPIRPLPSVDRPFAAATHNDGVLRVGVAQIDLTPPLRLGRTGYGPDQRPAYGAYGRLMATVAVVDDGAGERVALLSAELHAGFRWIAEHLGVRCAGHGLTVDRIFFSACHVHTGPGPFYGHATYDRIAGTAYLDDWRDHFDVSTATGLVERLATAIHAAVVDLKPGRVGYGVAASFGCAWNRSVDALLMMPDGADPADPDLAHPTAQVPRDAAGLRALAERINAGVTVPPLTDTGPREPVDEAAVEAIDHLELETVLEHDHDLRAETAFLVDLLNALEHGSSAEAGGESLEDVMHRLVKARRAGGDLRAAPVLIAEARKLKLKLWTLLPHRGLKEEVGDRALVDARVHCFWAENDGGSRAAICFFGATSTLLGAHHALYCADAYGVVSRLVERRLHRDADGAFPAIKVGMGGGSLGDVNLVSPHRTVAVHPRQAKDLLGALRLMDEAAEHLAEGVVSAICAAQGALFDQLKLTAAYAEEEPGAWDAHPVAKRGSLGASALAASEMAGGAAAIRLIGFKEGRSRLLVEPYKATDPQYPKVEVPRMEAPPATLAFRVVRFAGTVAGAARQVVLAGMPAEVSTLLATQTAEGVRAAVRAAHGADVDVPVVVASLVGDYAAYFGTPWEYLAQHYEGASQLWGRWVGAWSQHVVTGLATATSTRATGIARFSGGAALKPRTADPTGDPVPPPLPRLKRLADRKHNDLEVREIGSGVWEINAAWRDGPDPGRPLWAGPRVAVEVWEAGAWCPLVHQGVKVTDRTHPMLVFKDDLNGPWLFRVALDGMNLSGGRIALRITPDLREPQKQVRVHREGAELVIAPPGVPLEVPANEGAFDFLFGTPAWRHTDHAVGFVAPEGDLVRPITSASMIEADKTLEGATVDLRLDRLRVVDYPGDGEHQVLLTFEALHASDAGTEQQLAFAQRLRIREGEGAGVQGYPVFRGLRVGSRGLHLGFSTINISNAGDEAVLAALDSAAFRDGLTLAAAAQPALAPLTELATGLAKMLLERNRNVLVQQHVIGLDLDVAASGARLREGTYIAAQVPDASQIRWDRWRWDVASQGVVHATNRETTFDFNTLVFRVVRRRADG
jgi:hypothetical protein